MTAPVRIDLTSLSPEDLAALREALRTKPGQRSLETRAAIDQRDGLIREYAAKFYPHRSRNEQAQCVARDLARYAGSAWQRSRTEAACPHRDPVRQLLWRILKTRDHAVGARAITGILKIREGSASAREASTSVRRTFVE